MQTFLTLLGVTAAFITTRLFFAETAAVFAPTLAITFFAAVWARQTFNALAVPLVAYLIGDLVLGTGIAQIVVYANLLAFALLGRFVATQPLTTQYAAVFAGITLFDLTTNLAVWVGPFYPHTAEGLAACFTAALPFYIAKLNGLAAIGVAHYGLTHLRRQSTAFAH